MNRFEPLLILAVMVPLTCAWGAPARDGYTPDLAALAGTPRYAGTDRAALAAAEQASPSKYAPLQFAVGAEMPLELADGRWQQGETEAVWRMRVGSIGAKLIGVGFAQLRLPPSARLYLYDRSGSVVQGPYGAADVPADGRLVTAMVPGAEGVLELRVAAAERAQVQLKLSRIYHGFRTFTGGVSTDAAAVSPKSLTGDTAAACEVNVACPAGDSWRDPIRSAAIVQIGNGAILTLCTGELVNDLRSDNTPYLLTAHHCQIGAGATTPASSVVLYWNYQASLCGGSLGSLNQTQAGSTLVATDAGSDFTLLRLNQSPPADFKVYFAGWDASPSDIPTSGVAIHHPVADIKKISTFTQPAARQTIKLTSSAIESQMVEAWQISWTSGITQVGSSGAGLWNQDRRIVGVLSGGNTACAAGTASSGQDFFGRLDVAWNASSSPSGQLKAWLDPDNSGALCADGRNPADGAAVSGCAADTGKSSSGGNSDDGGGAWPLSSSIVLLPLIWLRRRRMRTA